MRFRKEYIQTMKHNVQLMFTGVTYSSLQVHEFFSHASDRFLQKRHAALFASVLTILMVLVLNYVLLFENFVHIHTTKRVFSRYLHRNETSIMVFSEYLFFVIY